MGLVKRTYVDGETVITADNLNDIQDAIIQNEEDITTKGTYSKPTGGIPKTDLASAVQTSLEKADTALQSSDIDNTLTVSGKAAGAKKTGDEISDVKNTLNHKADVIYDTASGDIASFPDGADGLPVKDLTVSIEPVQDLHGYANPWPAGGGVNQWDEDWEYGIFYSSGASYDTQDGVRSKNYCSCTSGASYYAKIGKSGGGLFVLWYDSNKDFLSRSGATNTVIQAPANAEYFKISTNDSYKSAYLNDISINSPATVTTYSPYSNICPISGWTGANVSRAGKNELPLKIADIKSYNTAGSWNGNTYTRYGVSATLLTHDVESEYAYGIKFNGTSTSNFFFDIIKNKPFLGDHFVSGGSSGARIYCIVSGVGDRVDSGSGVILPENSSTTVTMFVPNNTTNTDLIVYPQIEKGTKASAYEPYTITTLPISWQSSAGTVYGGTLDVTSGKMVVDRVLWTKNTTTMDNNNDYPGWKNSGIKDLIGSGKNIVLENQIMNIGTEFAAKTTDNNDTLFLRAQTYGKTQDEWIALAIDVQIAVLLATPLTYQLTPTEVTTLLGQNNIWADCGPSTVEYPCDTKLYIQKINAPSDDDMIADAQIESGKYFIVNNNLYLSTAAILAGDPIKPGTNCTLTNLAAALNALNS